MSNVYCYVGLLGDCRPFLSPLKTLLTLDSIPSIITAVEMFPPTPARVICCFTDWCNENTEVALRSQNFITEPLSRLEMNDIVRQVDFINR